MNSCSIYSINNKQIKPDRKSTLKNGIIFVADKHGSHNKANDKKILNQVNNRISQPVKETQRQIAKEGTGESMYNPSGGFERF